MVHTPDHIRGFFEFIAGVFSKAYDYLRRDPRVVRYGSIRSFEAAVNDLIMRIILEGGVDYPKFKELLIRVGVENLYLTVETYVPEDKKKVIIEALERALEEVESELANCAKGDKREGVEKAKGLEKSHGDGGSQGVGVDLKGGRTEEELRSDTCGQCRYGGASQDKDGREGLSTGVDNVGIGVRGTGDEKSTSILTLIQDLFYGGIGTANFLNLAQLVNMFVDPYANIVDKVKVLSKVENYLRGLGLFPYDDYTRVKARNDRMFEALRHVVKGRSSGFGQVKVVKFTSVDKYPTYVVGVREYRVGDGFADIDIQRTALNIGRKLMLNKPITNKDIIVREYANVKTIDIVLCLDVSGSMRELSSGVPKIEIAKDAITQYIKFLAETNDRLALILFNFRADVLWGLHLVRKYWRYMHYMLRYVYAGGGTNLVHALERSREVLARSRLESKHVICITDGRTVNSSLCIREAARLRRKGATISTIAVGENSDDDLLLKISKIGGGLFIKISSIHDLGRALIMDKLHSM